MAVVVLEARDIHKSYERGDEKIPVLNGLTVGLVAGSFTTLVGPSGCGKSTLLHICGAMDRPTSGEVRLEDESLTALDDDGLTRVRRERIGFVFQFFNLLPTLTVEQNIGLPLLLMGRSAQRVSDLSGQWAERVGISHRLNHFPSQLSGGEAQRVAIARAVIHQPVL
ncbi:MAG TPA: ATP-binding cassette domain-containing protein, partial [Acidobacteria bacterium]|nr:ATP-binding cassette domain-containing protein [Acidobacteriota bacterium]